ncbi:hypothetical protein BDW60DRAFT_177455 [Aspergillus nidulans var. acristatus]
MGGRRRRIHEACPERKERLWSPIVASASFHEIAGCRRQVRQRGIVYLLGLVHLSSGPACPGSLSQRGCLVMSTGQYLARCRHSRATHF